ncbi:MAG: 4'-phosphopantetheinyl transferase superfamily protein [Candidatus Krumholzibacteriia bacterium]
MPPFSPQLHRRTPAPAPIILGLGADLCEVARLERELARDHSDVLAAAFGQAEHERCRRHRHPARAYAACFAAKESVIKALAPAGGQGTFWQDIEIGESGGGGPVVTLQGRLAELARDAGIRRVVLSSAHCRRYATACAVATG